MKQWLRNCYYTVVVLLARSPYFVEYGRPQASWQLRRRFIKDIWKVGA